MAAWEYKTVTRQSAEPLTDDQLNQMGAQGFELVNVSIVSDQVTIVGRRETRNIIHYFFKRPKG